MTETEAKELVIQRMVDRWAIETAALLPPDGVPFVRPNKARPSSGTFVQLQLIPGSAPRITQGGPAMYQARVWIRVVIFVPENTGVQLASQIGDAAKRVFRGQTLTGTDELTIDATMPIGGGKVSGWDVSAVQFDSWYLDVDA